MFDVKTLKEKGYKVSKKRKYSLPVITLTAFKKDGGSYEKTYILEDGKLYKAVLNIVDEKIDYKKGEEIKDYNCLAMDFCSSFNIISNDLNIKE